MKIPDTQIWVVTRHQYGISALVLDVNSRGTQWWRVSGDVGSFLWLVSYLCSFIFTAVSARKNFELELATGGSIALINIHIRQSYVDCSHTP